MTISSKKFVKELYPAACLLGYTGNWFVATRYAGKRLGRGRIQREAWVDAAKNIKEGITDATPLS